jgi:thioredoxin reductase (NADPH)
MDEKRDIAVVGAGPAGLACAIYAVRAGLSSLVLEKGCIVNSIYHYPENMTFFTTAELLEIGDLPMTSSSEKPKRLDALKYYRRVAQHYGLDVRDYEKVVGIEGEDQGFTVNTEARFAARHSYQCRKIVVATGYYDNPNLLDVPGEELPHVSHYYTDPHPYFRKNVVVIGGKNSAAIAALELYRNGANVTLIHRGHRMGREVKYWIRPDLDNRIKNGEIRAFFSSRVKEIRPDSLVIETADGEKVLEADFIFALTGYHPDPTLLKAAGVQFDPETFIPVHDPDTLETNVPGIYVAGSVGSGRHTNRIFIENGRFHGEQIIPHLLKSILPEVGSRA